MHRLSFAVLVLCGACSTAPRHAGFALPDPGWARELELSTSDTLVELPRVQWPQAIRDSALPKLDGWGDTQPPCTRLFRQRAGRRGAERYLVYTMMSCPGLWRPVLDGQHVWVVSATGAVLAGHVPAFVQLCPQQRDTLGGPQARRSNYFDPPPVYDCADWRSGSLGEWSEDEPEAAAREQFVPAPAQALDGRAARAWYAAGRFERGRAWCTFRPAQDTAAYRYNCGELLLGLRPAEGPETPAVAALLDRLQARPLLAIEWGDTLTTLVVQVPYGQERAYLLRVAGSPVLRYAEPRWAGYEQWN